MARRGFPSMTALLGLLAVAGYQNRDKIAEFLRGPSRGPGSSGLTGGGLGSLFGNLGGASAGGFLSSGLSGLIDRFRQSGHGDAADSWVGTGPNKPCSARQIEEAIGTQEIDDLAQRLDMSREELVTRLCRELPSAVDRYTPEGRLPSEA